MMIHNYNSLIGEPDRKEYKGTLDSYFGHGFAQIIVDKRKAMIYSAQVEADEGYISQWFPDPREQRFFIRCMTLICRARVERAPIWVTGLRFKRRLAMTQ